MTAPRRPRPFDPRDFPDPLHVEPEPVEPSPGSARWLTSQPGYLPPARPKRYRLLIGSPRRGCSVLGYLVLAAVVLVGSSIAAPRSAPDPTSSSAVLDVRPGSARPSIPLTATSGPELSGAPQWSSVLGGYATWYADPARPADGLYAAAGPDLREALGDWRGSVVRVQAGRRWTTVQLSDACWCVDRRGRPTLLDVSPAAMELLAPDEGRRLGVVEVRVTWASPALPATDTR